MFRVEVVIGPYRFHLYYTSKGVQNATNNVLGLFPPGGGTGADQFAGGQSGLGEPGQLHFGAGRVGDVGIQGIGVWMRKRQGVYPLPLFMACWMSLRTVSEAFC